MRQHNGNTKNGLPWFVAQALMRHLWSLEATIYERTNLLSLLRASVSSIITADGISIAEKDLPYLEDMQVKLQDMRRKYEYILDDPENCMVAHDKRVWYDQTLDSCLESLMYLIQKYQLVDSSMMISGEVGDWGKL
jgi:hypothetical protein